MTFFRRLAFNLRYLRRPPWDSGIVPPEVNDFIATHQPGRALDLGCGSGTSSRALAKAGWCVTGVDFSRRAIKIATQKDRAANLNVDFLVADAANLPHFLFSVPYDLVLDIGCFHGFDSSGKSAYLSQLDKLLSPGGTWLVYGFFKPFPGLDPGLTMKDIELAQKQLALLKREDGTDRGARLSAWFWFQKESH